MSGHLVHLHQVRSMNTPRVTVLMPVFNGEEFLRAAIESILNQTFSDFELLIIDDGSTDGSHALAASYGDPRIRLEANEKNLGLIATLNRGLKLAQGEFIARMDADDISHPIRFERQVAYLDTHPKIGGCGTWFEKVTPKQTTIMRMPESPALIRLFLLFDNPFLHSSMMLRRSLLDTHGLSFDPNYPHSEDYDLWARCSTLTDMSNLPEVLVRYRDHPSNISHRYSREQDLAASRIRARQLEALALSPSQDELDLHQALVEFELDGELGRLVALRDWLRKVLAAGSHAYGIQEAAVHAHLARYWYGACARQAAHGWAAWRVFRSSPISLAAAWEWRWKLLLRCILRRPIVSST